MTRRLYSSFVLTAFAACQPASDGPSSIAVPDITISDAPEDITLGRKLFHRKGCDACHAFGTRSGAGPDLQGVTTRQSAKWIERMIVAPDVMAHDDAVARTRAKAFPSPMPKLAVNVDTELPSLLAYLKSRAN